MGFNLKQAANATKPEGGNFPVIPAGLYLGQVSKTEIKTSQAGNEYINLTIDVKNIQDGKPLGKIWHILTITEKNLYQIKRIMEAAGMPLDEDAADEEMSTTDLAKLLDKASFLIHTKVRPAEGNYKERAEIDVWGTMSGFAPIDEANKWWSIIVDGKDPDADDSFMNIPEDGDEEIVL